MPKTTSMFCSADDVRTELMQHEGYNSDDALIIQQIKKATALVRAYTRRSWEYGEYTDYFSTFRQDVAINVGRNYVTFPLKEKPIDLSVTPVVTFNSAGRFADTAPLEYGAAYQVDEEKNQVIMYPAQMEAIGRSLKITYTAGYPIDENNPDILLVAENLKMACVIQAAFTTSRILNRNTGSQQKSDKSGYKVYDNTKSGFIGEALHMIKSETRIMVGSNR